MDINTDPYIQVYDNVLSKDLCDNLIAVFEKNDSLCTNGYTHNGYTPEFKNTKELHFFQPCLIKYYEVVLHNMITHVIKYCDGLGVDLSQKDIDNGNKGFHIQKYLKNEGFYLTHTDDHAFIKDSKISSRIITFIFYLNDVNEGGETFFGNDKIKPKKGSLLLFPATWTYPHRGSMPVSHDKYIVTGWIYENRMLVNQQIS